MLREAGVSDPVHSTVATSSTKPSFGFTKNDTPRAACASVSAAGSVGLSDVSPISVPRYSPVAGSTSSVEEMALFEAGRSGVFA